MRISLPSLAASGELIRVYTAPANNSKSSTTASQQTTWLPPPAPIGQTTPQPTFTDFDLFQHSSTTARPQQATPHRAPSLDSTLRPSFNIANAPAFLANRNINSAQTIQRNNRLAQRPPVPLFHSNSTGNLPNQQYQDVTDFQSIDMGGGEINVAYDGTFGDLHSGGDAGLFGMGDTFDFTSFMDESGAADSMPATDFTAINNGGNATGSTVSPKDVFNDSVPPSTSFTNLTTPGSTYLETPNDDYQTSPMFSDNLLHDGHGSDNWFPLFPDADAGAMVDSGIAPAPTMARTASSSSANQIVVHPGGDLMHRKRSSTNASPASFSPVVKHSTVAGVNARKRDKPLPPIVVDSEDTVALKRARNTAAARKSRAKKVQERDELEAEIADLKKQVEHWKAIALGHAPPTDSNEE